MTTASTSGWTASSAAGSHQGTSPVSNSRWGSARCGSRSTPCRSLQILRRHGVAPVDDLPGPRVGGPGLGLLLVGHGHHPQGQDLVDLGGVEQRTGALRGHLRVVVQDDRRAQHHVGGAGWPGEHRPATVLVARGRRRRRVRGRVEQRDEPHRPWPRAAGGRRSARSASPRPWSVPAPARVPHPTVSRTYVVQPGPPRAAPRRPAASGGGRSGRQVIAGRPVQRLDVLPAGYRSTRWSGRRGRTGDVGGRTTSCSTASSQLTGARRPAVDRRGSSRASRCCSCRKRRCTVTSGSAVAGRSAQQALHRQSRRPRRGRPRPRPADRARRTASATGSSPSWPGRVEQVALVEHRVGDARACEAHGPHDVPGRRAPPAATQLSVRPSRPSWSVRAGAW